MYSFLKYYVGIYLSSSEMLPLPFQQLSETFKLHLLTLLLMLLTNYEQLYNK